MLVSSMAGITNAVLNSKIQDSIAVSQDPSHHNTHTTIDWYIIHHTSLLLMNTFRLFCFNADQNFRLHIEQMPYICKHIYTQPIRQDYKKMPNTFLN